MVIVLSSFVKEVIIALPTEIQCIIIRFVIHNYLKSTSFQFPEDQTLANPFYFPTSMDTTAERFQTPLHHLTNLMGIDTVWDNLLVGVIKELTFDHSIFYSKQLDKFVDFVWAKSIKIHLEAPALGIKLDHVGIELLRHGCCEYTSTVTASDLKVVDAYNWKFITVPVCDLKLLSNLFEVTENLKLLERLKCLKISTASSQKDLLDDELAQKLMTWRSNQKKRVVLSFDLDYLDKNSLFASLFVSKLADLNENGDFEIEYNGIRAMEPLGSRLLSDS
ncbi:unnamed protein product [Ambrosiozyma monospora]|uniref:Unnamed protein product n=1 Tax=Ambrosiozyma monospora TaxID=43982 RepID=A0ACB5TAC3_AMBMO|nr:unnamed protein product [Ambrosiozyma monospora]